MKFKCTGICVKDIKISRSFYENLFGLKVEYDFGKTIVFDCGLSLNEDFFVLAGISENEIKYKTNNFELYFEEDHFDDFILKLNKYENIEFVHNIKKYDWGQRIIRFYDLDKHIIEVAESADALWNEKHIKENLKNGLSIEETAKKSMASIEYVKKFIE
jgi:catechol 2,3-dioxygenase-like lactoylglutathione lyase family enzyme